MEQKKYKQINTKTPEIQEMILSYQIGGVAYELSQRLEISPALALDLFYRSKTCAQLHDKRTGPCSRVFCVSFVQNTFFRGTIMYTECTKNTLFYRRCQVREQSPNGKEKAGLGR